MQLLLFKVHIFKYCKIISYFSVLQHLLYFRSIMMLILRRDSWPPPNAMTKQPLTCAMGDGSTMITDGKTMKCLGLIANIHETMNRFKVSSLYSRL